MKLTRSVGYAVGILLRVDSAGGDEPMTADAISKGCRFPPRFLYRVLRRMVDAGLLDGISGPRGGYTLAKKPGQIRLLDIVEAVDEVENESGLVAVTRAHRPVIGFINQLCDQNIQRFRRDLARVSLSNLAARASRKKGGRKSTSAKGASRKKKS
jgi:Rrf2 family protein